MTRKRKAIFCIYIILLAVLTLIGLKLIDKHIGKPFAGLDLDSKYLTIRTLELHPYDGFHVQANVLHCGPMHWEGTTAHHGARIRTGEKGFFIDFSLSNPPAKASNEVRIILIGGSGAQGWGATCNHEMFYQVIEHQLNQKFPDLKFRVINMAMGSSVIYQNFIALNRDGHKLMPDLILAYIGRNDFVVPIYEQNGSDFYAYSQELQAFTYAMRGSEMPSSCKWIDTLMPNTMRMTSLGMGIKIAADWNYFRKRSLEGYQWSTGTKSKRSAQEIMDSQVIPDVIHGLKSIKRDFDGVPIMIAWQGIGYELNHSPGLQKGFYDRMLEKTMAGVTGYKNDWWFLVNIHQIGLENRPTNRPSQFATHLDDRMHNIVGRLIADNIAHLKPSLREIQIDRKRMGLKEFGQE